MQTIVKTISKVPNFLGHYFVCSCCHRDNLKHGYRVNNSKEIFGSECVKKMAGYEPNMKKEADVMMRQLIAYKNNGNNWEWALNKFGSEERVIEFFMMGNLR